MRKGQPYSHLTDQLGLVAEAYAGLPQRLKQFVKDQTRFELSIEGSECRSPSISVSPEVGEWKEGEGRLLTFTTPHRDKFQDAGKKEV